MQKEKNTDPSDYKIAKDLVAQLDIGEVRTVKLSGRIEMFRNYLTTESQKVGKKFTTKSGKNGEVYVARIKKESVWDKLKGSAQ